MIHILQKCKLWLFHFFLLCWIRDQQLKRAVRTKEVLTILNIETKKVFMEKIKSKRLQNKSYDTTETKITENKPYENW